MKLSIKELQLLRKGLSKVTCGGDPLYKKIDSAISKKQLKLVSECGLRQLVKTIKAIKQIDSYYGICDTNKTTSITVDYSQIEKGDIQKIFDYKDKNPNVIVKIEY